mgnify:CR=1 FL=1
MVIFKIYSIFISIKLVVFLILILKKYRVPNIIRFYLVLFINNLIFNFLNLNLFYLLRYWLLLNLLLLLLLNHLKLIIVSYHILI